MILLSNADNCVISDVTINGNAVNQLVGDSDMGILIGSSTNSYVTGATITNCRIYGFYSYVTNYAYPNANNGIINSVVTNCGWNGIQVGYGGVDSGLYAINNTVAYCSDVGISAQGHSCLVENNYVHDMNGTTGSNNARWGIATETGNGHNIIGNIVTNCNIGLVSTAPNNNFSGE